jgi:hypothetical protein
MRKKVGKPWEHQTWIFNRQRVDENLQEWGYEWDLQGYMINNLIYGCVLKWSIPYKSPIIMGKWWWTSARNGVLNFQTNHVSRWKSTIFGIGNRNCHGSICWQCWAVCIWTLVVFTRVDVYHGNTYCICIYILYNIVETQYIIYYIYI